MSASEEHRRLLALQPGAVVADKYEIVQCLGMGTLGAVYLCRSLENPQDLVALKEFSPTLLNTEAGRISLRRFRNEIAVMLRIKHPHVVRIFEYISQKDLVAYTMEYVRGGDLASYLRTHKNIPITTAVRMLLQMCSGVEAIRASGIVHRDLKPSNILLDESLSVKIADFGIARSDDGPRLTARGGVVGTIEYLSPQYLENGIIDAQSDVYALGVIAYEMLVGFTPFAGNGVLRTVELKISSDPPAPIEKNPAIPETLSEIVLRALSRDTEKRYRNAAEMVVALSEVMNSFPEEAYSPAPEPVVVNRPLYPDISHLDPATPGVYPGASKSPAVRISSSGTVLRPLPYQRSSRLASLARIGAGGALLGMLLMIALAPQLTSTQAPAPQIIALDESQVQAQPELDKQEAGSGSQTNFDSEFAFVASPSTDNQLSKARFVPPVNNREPLSGALAIVDGGVEDFALPVTQPQSISRLEIDKLARTTRILPVASSPSAATNRPEQKFNKPAVSPKRATQSPSVGQPPAESRAAEPPPAKVIAKQAKLESKVKEPVKTAPVDPFDNLIPYIVPLQPIAEPSTENKVRATLLYRLADFIEWPVQSARSTSDIRICIAGDDPFGEHLDILLERARTKTGARLTATRVSLATPVGALLACQILYLHDTEKGLAKGIIAPLHRLPILTITDDVKEGVIDFFVRDRKVKFSFDSEKAAAAGLKVAPVLIDLAESQ